MLRTLTTTIFAAAILTGCASYHSDVEEASVEASDTSTDDMAEGMASDASAEGMTDDMATEEGQTDDSSGDDDDEGQGGGERVGG